MIAVDTNVLIYACDQTDPRRQQIALELVTRAEDGVLLWQVACEFIAASRKLSNQGFTSIHAWNRLAEFRDLLPLVTPSAGRPRPSERASSHARRLVLGCADSGSLRGSRRGGLLLGGPAGLR